MLTAVAVSETDDAVCWRTLACSIPTNVLVVTVSNASAIPAGSVHVSSAAVAKEATIIESGTAAITDGVVCVQDAGHVGAAVVCPFCSPAIHGVALSTLR